MPYEQKQSAIPINQRKHKPYKRSSAGKKNSISSKQQQQSSLGKVDLGGYGEEMDNMQIQKDEEDNFIQHLQDETAIEVEQEEENQQEIQQISEPIENQVMHTSSQNRLQSNSTILEGGHISLNTISVGGSVLDLHSPQNRRPESERRGNQPDQL